MKSTIQNKDKLVNSVFSEVYKKYDLMNDIMSLGIEFGRKNLWMGPLKNKDLIDVTSGTGDIAKLFLKKSGNTGRVVYVEPNIHMLEQGKKRLNF